jgi:hypothetical protein
VNSATLAASSPAGVNTSTTAVSTVIAGVNYALQSAESSEPLNVSLLFESSPIQISLITQS